MMTAGCGLIDSDITNFDLSLPDRSFTINTEQWNVDSSTTTFPDIPCSADMDICAEAVTAYCAADRCTGVCASDLCEMTFQVSLWRDVDLYSEKPELQTIDNQPLVNVTIDNVHYQVTENTLNFDTPELVLYVAPKTVMNPSDPQARRIGVIPTVPAGSQSGAQDILVTPDGEVDLKAFMRDYRTPFNIIIGSEVTVQAGDPMPIGRIIADVGVEAHAGI
jgi:hypothetical protein